MAQDMNDRVAAYGDLVRGLAEDIARSPAARRCGAEYDDLQQEGLIAVWQALERGNRPSAEVVTFRMLGWIRLMANQKDPTSDHVPYDQLLPMDDFRASEAR